MLMSGCAWNHEYLKSLLFYWKKIYNMNANYSEPSIFTLINLIPASNNVAN